MTVLQVRAATGMNTIRNRTDGFAAADSSRFSGLRLGTRFSVVTQQPPLADW
jgi:hypothetical protein